MLVTPEQMQILEKLTDASGISYADMMERAGYALAMRLISEYPQAERFLFLAGNGNNGGDCYVAAHYLQFYGKTVQILAINGKPRTEIAKRVQRRALQEHIFITENMSDLQHADIVIDGIFGTGFRGALSEEIQKLLNYFPDTIHVACDIPSGGSGLTGQVSPGIFHADMTVTFGAVKFGMSQYPLRKYCGKIIIADIGIPKQAFAQVKPIENVKLSAIKNILPSRQPDAYKNQMGHVLVIAGSVRMRGACVLAAKAAMRSGAGLLTCASAETVCAALMQHVPECMCLPLQTDAEGFLSATDNYDKLAHALENKQAVLLGCGLGMTEQTQNLTKFVLSESHCPIILDADGLNSISSCIEYIPKGRTILTPHAGEAARLLGIPADTVQKDRLSSARQLADSTGAVVILKGAGTIITDGCQTAVCQLGNAGMARAGSGDVLAGITASLVAQGMDRYQAACSAVTMHAAAGDKTAEKMPYAYMLPQDLINSLQEILS